MLSVRPDPDHFPQVFSPFVAAFGGEGTPGDLLGHRPVGAGLSGSDTFEGGTRSGGTGPITPTENALGEEKIGEGKAVLNREGFIEALGDNVSLMTLMRVGHEEEGGERVGLTDVVATEEVQEGVKVAEGEEEEEDAEVGTKLYLLVSAFGLGEGGKLIAVSDST